MMNKKRVRETIFNLVDHWCSEEPIYRADLPWIRGQISFAYMIEAITLSEKEELVKGCSGECDCGDAEACEQSGYCKETER